MLARPALPLMLRKPRTSAALVVGAQCHAMGDAATRHADHHVMAAVVDLPLEPVTPTTGAGQARRKSSISLLSRAPASAATEPAGSAGGATRLETTDEGSDHRR